MGEYINTPNEDYTPPARNINKSAAIMGKGEVEILQYLDLIDRESGLAKRGAFSGVDNFQDVYRGIQWPKKMPKHRVPAVINLVQQLVERKAALMTDSKPIIKVIPTIYAGTNQIALREHRENAAQALEKVIEGIWFERGMDVRLARSVMIAEILGGVGFNTIMNKSLGTSGDMDILVLDPRCIGADPFVTESERLKNGQYVVTSEVMATDYLRSIFYDSKDKIIPDKHYSIGVDEGEGSFRAKIRQIFKLGGTAYSFNAIGRSTVRNYWLKNYETMEVNGKRLPKYLGGRHIVRVGNRIIVDEPNPYIDGECPIDYLDWHLDINSMWGFGDVELYKSPQEVFNKLLATIIENAMLMTNNIWVGDEDALAPKDWNKLSNVPGSFVKKRRGRDLNRVAPPPLSTGIFNALSFITGSMDKLSGITEAVAGQRPGQVTSGIAIENLQVAAQTVIRLKARHLEMVLMSIGQKMISRTFQFMTSDRIFTITGDAGQMNSYHFERKRLAKDKGVSFKDFKFQIQPGSSLSSTKFQKGLLATQLFSMGILDEKAVLDAIEYPDRESILERVGKKQLAQLQMMQEQAQAGKKPTNHPQSRGGNGTVPRPQQKTPGGALGQERVHGAPDVSGRGTT